MDQELEQVRIRDLLKNNPKGLTIEEVSKKLSLNRATAAKYLNTLMLSGQAELRELGRAKIYYLSQRLPLTNLLSISSDLILILDRDLFITEINEPFLSFFNLTKDELKGRKIEHTPVAPFFPEGYLPALENAAEGKESALDVHVTANGEKRYFLMKMIPLVFEGGGRAVGIILEDISGMKRYQHELEEGIRDRTLKLINSNIALHREVEEHKKSERALRESEAVLRSMLDATPTGVGLIVNRVFQKVNTSLCEMTGYTEEELTGQNTRVLYPDDEEYFRIDRELYTVMNDREPGGVAMRESRIRKKDGTIIDVIISLSPFDPRHPASGVTATVLDVTERKRSDEALKRATRQVSLLTTVTRHDILNQLTALRGYLSRMKKMDANETMAELIGKEETIAETIRSQIIFTRDYQNVGLQPPAWIRITDLLALMEKTTDAGAAALEIRTGSLEVFADPLIEKVFSNLIENSLRHGGHVTRIAVSVRSGPDGLSIVYEDNGVGIPDTDKDRIFSREYGKSAGYGMFLIREILSITGLSIRETGVHGTCARFEIRVPQGSFRYPGSAG